LRLSTGETDPIPRRQSLPPAYHREGSIYVTRREALAGGSLYGSRTGGYLMDPSRSVNIDEIEDWERAERLVMAAGNWYVWNIGHSWEQLDRRATLRDGRSAKSPRPRRHRRVRQP